jgi:hypothetical protein
VSEFDGWGCVRLLDAAAMTEIDEYCLTEELDPAFSSGFGDLTVHEVEVPRGDPNEGTTADADSGLAYFSWYSGGFRVVDIAIRPTTEVGHYIDPSSSNLGRRPGPGPGRRPDRPGQATGLACCSSGTQGRCHEQEAIGEGALRAAPFTPFPERVGDRRARSRGEQMRWLRPVTPAATETARPRRTDQAVLKGDPQCVSASDRSCASRRR